MKKLNFNNGRLSALKKPFLIMKLTLLLTVYCTFHAFAGLDAQSITLKANDTEISQLLNTIEKQGNFRFLYNTQMKDLKQRVTINLQNAPLNEVLTQLFTGTSISYKHLDDNLIALRSSDPADADIRVTGRITNEAGEGTSASVKVKGSPEGTATDANGNFSLTVPDNAVLVISAVGYETQEVAVDGRQQITVKLVQSTRKMDEVVVIGYGSLRKVEITGSVNQIKGDELVKQGSPNAASALQGKIPGLQVSNYGSPGASPQITLRGIGTVSGSSTPLFVVDGIWFGDISFLNPADIESVSVLKDAASESIYGVRAANGVILITTKKGKANQSSVNYNVAYGWQTVTNQIKMANAQEYATMVNELAVINHNPAFLDPAQYSEGTDWYHQILRSASIATHQLSFNGGTEKASYSLSLGYLNQDGIVETNNFKRYTARMQTDFQPKTFLKVGYNIAGSFMQSNDINGSIFRQLFTAGPVVPVFYSDGTYGDPNDYKLGGGNNYNPQATIDFFNQKSKTYRYNGGAYIEAKFAKHFTWKTTGGGEIGQGEVRSFTPVYSATLSQRNTTYSSLTKSQSASRYWILENTLAYENKFGDHSLKMIAGQSAQRTKSSSLYGTANSVPYYSDATLYLSLGNDSTRSTGDGGALETSNSYFGRLNYSFLSKYFFMASLRADGSSKFTSWGYFPSFGASWLISNEKFMANQKVFNTLKIRGSWGKIGNKDVPIGVTQLTVSGYPVAVWGNGSTSTAQNIATVVPPVLRWEVGVGTDIGFEAGLLNNRLFVEASYYNKLTKDAVFVMPILSSVGMNGGINGNQATFRNRGIELNFTWKDNIGKNFNYSVGGNLTYNNNIVLKVAGGPSAIISGGGSGLTGGATATRTYQGVPIGEFFGYQVSGIFQNASEVAASAQKTTAQPGDFIYVDQNKDGTIDKKDLIDMGSPHPKYQYGINTACSYLNFDFAIDFQGVAGVKIYNANLGWRYGNENFTEEFYKNRWHGEGTSNYYPSVNIGGGQNYLPNTFYVEDGSYFRIRNIQLGYAIPMAVLDRIHIKKLRVYASAQNAVNLFKYRGFSPEIAGGGTLARGMDANVYPLSATYNFGLNLTF